MLACLLLTAVPMLVVDVPPLTDLPAHMGRYRVQLDLPTTPALRAFYDFRWELIGNLGVDLLVAALAPLLGLEGAVRLIVGAIPVLTAAGFLCIAREAHGAHGNMGGVTAGALFALPLAYGYPLHFGFVNFALSAALATLALALWMRLGRQDRGVLRAALFVPIGLGLWVTHVYGWALLAMMAAPVEIIAQAQRGKGQSYGESWPRAIVRAGMHGLSLAPPLILMLLWRSGAAGTSFNWFDWDRKAIWAIMTLRDRWEGWDVGSVTLLGGLVLLIIPLQLAMGRRRTGFDPGLITAGLLLCAAFAALPATLFGSAYADMRIVPYALAVALLAIRPDAWGGWGRAAFLAGVAFFAARTATTTASFVMHDRAWRAELAALAHVPRGARLVTFVAKSCPAGWAPPRFDHLASMALVRRGAFANDQWDMPGAQLLRVRYPAGKFARDPSQFVVDARCASRGFPTIDQSLRTFPRDAFDYVWLIDPPNFDQSLTRGLRPIWRYRTSVLFLVEREPDTDTSGFGATGTRASGVRIR